MGPTEKVVQVSPDVIMPSFQHIACVKAIDQEEPTKHLDLRYTFGFPQPTKGSMGGDLSKE